MSRILSGHRIGRWNQRWAMPSTILKFKDSAKARDRNELKKRWIAGDDARNYVVFGDPAARLRVASRAASNPSSPPIS